MYIFYTSKVRHGNKKVGIQRMTTKTTPWTQSVKSERYNQVLVIRNIDAIFPYQLAGRFPGS